MNIVFIIYSIFTADLWIPIIILYVGVSVRLTFANVLAAYIRQEISFFSHIGQITQVSNTQRPSGFLLCGSSAQDDLMITHSLTPARKKVQHSFRSHGWQLSSQNTLAEHIYVSISSAAEAGKWSFSAEFVAAPNFSWP